MSVKLRCCRRPGLAAALLIFSSLLTIARPAGACSMCRCGDPTFNALGTDVYAMDKLRVALDWERFDKQQGPGDSAETMSEDRFTTALSYTFSDRVTAVARIPYSSRTLREPGQIEVTEAVVRHEGTEPALRDTTSDLADPELYALVRLWSSPFSGGMGSRAWISALGGVKTNWGRNDLRQGGVRLDEHLQPGTGSTDVFGGLSGFYLLNQSSSVFGSVQLRRMGRNDFGYRYGDVSMATAGYERKITAALDGVLTLDFRDAGRDLVGDEGSDPDTGGRLLYVSPKLSRDFGRGLVGRLSVQVPVVEDLNGDQDEKAVVNLGVTWLY
ncbi:MAG TPA: hypothetical protein VEW48_23360 [Thermoanaerobaculia bacterium]|nr:hypothetical protein [Thermoanaerobaculia bacterium]